MSSLLGGYKFHVLARYGLASRVPAAKLGEMLWDMDTKTFRVGDDTSSPPRIMSEKSTGVFSYKDISHAEFSNIRLVEGGTIDGIKPSDLNKGAGFPYRISPGQFENIQITSNTNSISVGSIMATPDLPDTFTMSLDLNPELLSLLSNGFDLRNIPFAETLPNSLEEPLYRYQDTLYYWNSSESTYEAIGMPIIREYARIPTSPGPFTYIDATNIQDFRLMMWTGAAYTYIGSEANVVVDPVEPPNPPQGSYWYHNEILQIFVNNQWLTIAFDSPTSDINLAKRGVLLQWRYDDEGYAWEFWADQHEFNMRQLGASQNVSTVANDDTITVENAYAFTPGRTYVVYDGSGAITNITVFSVVSPTTIRATDTLNVTIPMGAGGRIGSTSFEINDNGTATVFGNQEYFSRPIRTLHSWPGGSLIIQRSSIDSSGLYTVRYREVGMDIWKEAELVLTRGVEFSSATEEEYRIPLGNTSVEFWISYTGSASHREVVNHFALITQYQNFDSDRIEKPTNISPSDQATNISVTPTLEGSMYRSLYGLAQAGAHFQISRDSSFYDLVLNTSSDTLVSWVGVTSETGTFNSITMLTDREAIAVGNSGLCVYTEDGGVTWEDVAGANSENLTGVTWNGSDTILAVGASATVQYTNDYGVNWINAASVDGFAGTLNAVAAHDSYAVAVGTNGKILSSINKGAIWSSATTAAGFTGTFNDVVMTSAGRCIAVGANGTIQTSADYGVNWIPRTPAAAFNGTFYGVTLTENGFAIAVGANGTIQTSGDYGSTWVTRSAAGGYASNFFDVVMLGSKAIAVGANGEIQTSYNQGQTWVKRPAGSGNTSQMNSVAMNAEPYAILVGNTNTIQHTYVLEGEGTTFTVPIGADLLEINKLYWWRVRYQDSVGKWSSWSDPTAFATQSSFSFVGQPSNIAPASDATSVSNVPTLQSSNFSFGGSIPDTHTSSQWQVALSASFDTPAYDSGSSTDLIQHAVPSASMLNNFTEYWWRIRHIGVNIGPGPWSIPTKFVVRAVPNAPTITGPVNNSTGVLLAPIVTTSSFISQDPNSPHVASQYQFSLSSSFVTIAFDSEEVASLTSYQTPAGTLIANTKYYVRARHKGMNSTWSNWSPVVTFTTMVVNILTPTVAITVLSGVSAQLRSTNFAVTAGANDSHVSSDWEVRTANNGTGTLLWSSMGNTSSRIQINAEGLPPGSTLFARVRHKGSVYGDSNWSESVSFNTPTITGQQVYTTPGTYNFTVPIGVFTICAVCIGGGGNGYVGSGENPGDWATNGTGGSGGGNRWRNNIPVTPGEVIPVVVGGPGQPSYILNRLLADGGSHGSWSGAVSGGGGNLYGGTGGGGNGGNSHIADDRRTSGGGGAGGYTGNGGSANYAGPVASGGGGGNGHHGLHSPRGRISGGGGGVGLIALGATGGSGGNGYNGGGGGSGGENALGYESTRPNGGRCGGGGGSRNGGTAGLGAAGGVRIIWGPNRSYPSNSQ